MMRAWLYLTVIIHVWQEPNVEPDVFIDSAQFHLTLGVARIFSQEEEVRTYVGKTLIVTPFFGLCAFCILLYCRIKQ